MPPPAGTLRVGRYFLALLAIVAVIYGIVFLPGQRHTPKLGLDLQGGTQVVYEAEDNGKTPAKSAMRKLAKSSRSASTARVSPSRVVLRGRSDLISIPGKSARTSPTSGRRPN